jgi:circadian clock protein KaiC
MVQTPSERNRVLCILKSRGMGHSNQLREYTLSARGVDLLDVYDSGGEEATGTGRLRQQAHAEAEEKVRSLAAEQGLRARAQTRRNLQAQIAELETQLSETKLDRQREQRRVQSQAATLRTDQTRLARARKED